MALQSRLFSGDPKLEAAAVSHSAHIVPGATGDHVRKIQHALLVLGEAGIEPEELEGKSYGPSTANAVLAFKTERDIVNRSYQTHADNIAGIMTMAALDKEMVESETGPRSVRTISCRLDGGIAADKAGNGGMRDAIHALGRRPF